jgi:beta-glucanase (GH16 family)
MPEKRLQRSAWPEIFDAAASLPLTAQATECYVSGQLRQGLNGNLQPGGKYDGTFGMPGSPWQPAWAGTVAVLTANRPARAAVRLATAAALVTGAILAHPAPTSAASAAVSATGTLLFDDEFTGPAGSQPDPAKWSIDTGYWNAAARQLECYTNSPDNVRLDGHGHLILAALYSPGTNCGTATLDYTSGRLDTNQKFSAQYGSIQVRMRVPTAQGMWPAFWAVGVDSPTVGDPNAGEMDVMEALGSDAGTRTVYGSLHGPYPDPPGGYWSAGGTATAWSDLSNWHTYGVSWAPGTVSFQLDGNTYYTASQSSVPPAAEWVFDAEPFYLILNLAVGGSWPGNPDASTVFPQAMKVDWVRVYSE